VFRLLPCSGTQRGRGFGKAIEVREPKLQEPPEELVVEIVNSTRWFRFQFLRPLLLLGGSWMAKKGRWLGTDLRKDPAIKSF